MKIDFKKIAKDELSGWRAWEIGWLVLACGVIITLSVYWEDTLMGIISSTAGVACVICTGKGKLSAYAFGLVNSILYAIISFNATYYGETMLNAIYYVPMQFIGFFVWLKHMNPETHEVEKKHMTNAYRVPTFFIMATATVGYGFILKCLGDAMPFVDSFTTVSSIVAMIVSVGMYAEQWWIWVGVNVFSIYMWWTNFSIGNENIATLLMWGVYLINSVVMLLKWEKEVIMRKKEAVK